MNHIRTALTLALVTGLTACEGPVGPCGARHACQVTGVDLAVTSMRIVSGERVGTDPVTKLPIYKAAPIEIEVTVVNRGDTISAEDEWHGIPPLRPGESYTTVMDRTPVRIGFQAWDDTTDARYAEIESVSFRIDEDADNSNNHRNVRFHVERPVIAIRGKLHNRTELRANSPFVMWFEIENRSARAPGDSMSVVLCAVDYDIGCWGWWPYFARIDLPRVEVGSRYENAHPVTMPMYSMVWPDANAPTDIDVCIMDSAEPGPYIPFGVDAPVDCAHVAILPVRPDFESCNPPVLELGVTVTLEERNCSQHPVSYPEGRFAVSHWMPKPVARIT